MKKINWETFLAIILLILSAALYFAHFSIYGNANYIFNSVLARIAFVPIQILLITIIMNRLLMYRAKRARLKKLNMVIGAFFSQVGTWLLAYFSDHDPQLESLRNELNLDGNCDDTSFKNLSSNMKKFNFSIQVNDEVLAEINTFLEENRGFLLRLLENPNLLEHQTFSNLLWATFHLAEELKSRGTFADLPVSDYQHLSMDIKRAYQLLTTEWLCYINHLRINYPYFFSHAMRTNPFSVNASPIVT